MFEQILNKIQNIPQYKGVRSKKIEEGLLKLKEWQKNPTAENWLKQFRRIDSSGQLRTSEFSMNLRKYMNNKPLPETTKKVFDALNIKNILGKNIENIKSLDKQLINIRQTAGTKARAKQQIRSSFESIKGINEQFKFDPDSTLEEITESLYGNQYSKGTNQTKIKLLTDTSNDVAKYLEILKSGTEGRKVPNLKLPNQETINNIVDNISDNTQGFRFQEGTIRRMKFNIRDSLLGLKQGVTENLRRGLTEGAKRVIDETVGLSATYENAPGYTEATQFLKPKTNEIKSKKIDKFFKPALESALQGNFKKVYEYNKKANKFKKQYPKVDVPIIKIGKNIKPQSYIKHFKNFSPEAQKNILDLANKKGIVIQTSSKPLNQIVKEFRKANLLKGAAKTGALAGLGLTVAGAAMAGEELSKASGVSEPFLYGAAASPFAFKPVRQKAIQGAKFLGKGAAKILPPAYAYMAAADIGTKLQEGYTFPEALEYGLIGTDIIGGIKKQSMLTPKEREAQQVINNAMASGAEELGGMGYIQGPSTLSIQEAEGIMQPGLKRVEQQLEEQRAQRRAEVAKRAEGLGSLEDIYGYGP